MSTPSTYMTAVADALTTAGLAVTTAELLDDDLAAAQIELADSIGSEHVVLNWDEETGWRAGTCDGTQIQGASPLGLPAAIPPPRDVAAATTAWIADPRPTRPRPQAREWAEANPSELNQLIAEALA